MAASSKRSPANPHATSPDSASGAHRISGEHSVARASESVTSRENRWIKLFRAALAGDAVRTPGTSSGADDEIVGIEGPRLVETALHSGTPFVALLASESGSEYLARFAEVIPPDAKLLQTTDRLFAQIAGTETPQGIAALVRPHAATFDDLVCGNPLVLLLAGVQDPGNVGTLIRTAEAFGATGVAACAAGGIGTANPFGPKALRASAGSALRLPTLRGVSAPILLAQLRVADVKIYAACRDEGDSSATSSRVNSAAQLPAKYLAPWEIDWRAPSALLVGNEGAGLPPELVRSADHIVRIPQGAARNAGEPMDSLNAATAGAVLLYEAARQRGMH